MKIMVVKAKIEAVLFAIGDSMSIDKIAELIGHDKETTRKILNQMMDDYAKENRGIQIIRIDNNYQLCTKEEYYQSIVEATNKVEKFELTEIQLETLSIVAYKQPITKAGIEKIRGVKSDHAVNKLIQYKLIEEKGRMETPGRPILLGTTEEFMRNFGLHSLEELPSLDDSEIETIKTQVDKEVQVTFDLGEDKK